MSTILVLNFFDYHLFTKMYDMRVSTIEQRKPVDAAPALEETHMAAKPVKAAPALEETHMAAKPVKAAPALEETHMAANPVSMTQEFKKLFFLSIVLVLVLAGGQHCRSVVQPAGKQHVPLPAHGPSHGEFQFPDSEDLMEPGNSPIVHDAPETPSKQTDAENITESKSMEESGDHTLGYGTIPMYATATIAAVGLACKASEFTLFSMWFSELVKVSSRVRVGIQSS